MHGFGNSGSQPTCMLETAARDVLATVVHAEA